MDKLQAGITAGIAGWIATFSWNIPLHYLGISKLRYMDFVAVLTYGHFPKNALESSFALAITVVWFVLLALVFSRFAGKSHLVFKGVAYGGAIWIGSYWITLLFHVPEIQDIDVVTSFCNFVGGLLYGLTMSYVLKRLVYQRS